MQLDLRLLRFLPRDGRLGALFVIPWPFLCRIGLIALAIIFVLSTQFLFQADLYDIWPVTAILEGWLDHFLDLLVVGGCIFAAVAGAASLRVGSGIFRHLLLLGSIASGAFVGETLLTLRLPLPLDVSTAGIVLAKGARWLAVAGLAYAIHTFVRRTADAERETHESELQRMQLDRQMTEARLQSLRAQIEPHFLFNTLANVRRLYQTDPDVGRKMLANFVAYLRAALPQLRDDETTLRQEVDLARAYLSVLQVRMGERLRFRFELPTDIGELPFPPFALSTLTENAIKHGLNPLPEGGSICITGRVDDQRLTVEVADTGAGLRQNSGSGAGVANLRARLAALYGSDASLKIEVNAPHGIRATIAIPAKSAHGRHD